MKNKLTIPLITLLFFFSVFSVKLTIPELPGKMDVEHSLSSMNEDIKHLSQNLKVYSYMYPPVDIIFHGDVLFAKEKTSNNIQASEKSSGNANNMDENIRRGILIKVMLITLIVWLGFACYLFSLDRKISKLEKEINES